MPPVTGAAVELAASLTWAGLEAEEQRIQTREDKQVSVG